MFNKMYINRISESSLMFLPLCGHIRITCACDLYPLAPHFYMWLYWGLQGYVFFLLIFALKHRLRVVFRTASVRRI